MDGKHATSNRAQSSTQPPPQFVPPRVRRRRADPNIKGKGLASSSVINPANSNKISDDYGSPVPRNSGKRSIGSAAYSDEKEGSRGIKSRKSGSDNYQEALSNFNGFSFICSEEREAKEKYSLQVVKKVVQGLKLERTLSMYLLKELLDEEFRALFLSFTESEQMTWIELFIVLKIVPK